MAVTPQDIHNRLRTVGTWVDWSTTPFDGFKYNAGNRYQTVQTVGVTWHPSLRAIERARDLGCTLLIFHEPLFYDDATPGVEADPGYAVKKRILDQTGMVLYRSHDFQDLFPQHGVHDQWKRFLGLEGTDVQHWDGYVSVSVEPPRTVGELADQVARKSATLGQPDIRVVGDREQIVRRVAYGTGAVAWPRLVWSALNADLVICTEVQWVEEARVAIDRDKPLIVVDHGVSEIAGVRACKEWMASQWPSLQWHSIDNDLEYEVIRGVASVE